MGRWAPVHQPSFATERAQRFAHFFECYTFVCQASTSNDDQIKTGSQLGMEFAYGFAEPALDTVPLRGAADTPSDREAVTIVLVGIGQDGKYNKRCCPRSAAPADPIKLKSPA